MPYRPGCNRRDTHLVHCADKSYQIARMASLKHRLTRSIADFASYDLSQQSFLSCLSLVDASDARDMPIFISCCLKDISKASKSAAKSRLLVLSQALLLHGYGIKNETILEAMDLLLSYASSQLVPANISELRRVTDSLMHLFLSRVVDSLMNSMSLLTGIRDDELQRLEASLTERVFGSTLVPRPGGRSIPISCYLVLDQMIQCAKAFVHIKIVVDSVATVLDKILQVSHSASCLESAEILMPIQRSVELLSIGLKPKTCSKVITLLLKCAASKSWQVREQAFASFQALASSVVMSDPLYPDEPHKIVNTPAVKMVCEHKPAISTAVEIGRFDRIPSVRSAAHGAFMALERLPLPSLSQVSPAQETKAYQAPASRCSQERKRWSAGVVPVQRLKQSDPTAPRHSNVPGLVIRPVSAPKTRPKQPARAPVDLGKKPRAAVYAALDQASAPRHPFLKADKAKLVEGSRLQWSGEARIRRPLPLPPSDRDFGIIILAKPKPAHPPPLPLPSIDPTPPKQEASCKVENIFTFDMPEQRAEEEERSPIPAQMEDLSPPKDATVHIHVYSSPERSVLKADKGVANELLVASPEQSPPISISPIRAERSLLQPESPTRSSPSISLSVSIHNNIHPLEGTTNGIGRGRDVKTLSDQNQLQPADKQGQGRHLDFKPLVMQATFQPLLENLNPSDQGLHSPDIIEVEGQISNIVYEDGKTPAQSPPLLAAKTDPLRELAGMMERLEALRHSLLAQQHSSPVKGPPAPSSSPSPCSSSPSPRRPRAWQEEVALGNRYGSSNRGSPSQAVVSVTGAMKSPKSSPSSMGNKVITSLPPPGSYAALLSKQWQPGYLNQLERYLQ